MENASFLSELKSLPRSIGQVTVILEDKVLDNILGGLASHPISM